MPISVLRYFGAKNRLAPWISQHFPPHTCYVEPFGGSAAVLLNKAPSKVEIYNDLDGQVVNLFRVLRDKKQAKELIRLVALTPFSRADWQASWKTNPTDPVELAYLVLIRAWMSHSGDARGRTTSGWGFFKNDKGGRRVSRWVELPDQLAAAVDRLKLVQVSNYPALDLIAKCAAEPGVLYYIDPPYPFETRKRRFRKAYTHEMGEADHRTLAEALHQVKGKVVISSYHGLYDELYKGWPSVEITTQADGHGKSTSRVEVLYLSPNCEVRLF